MLKRFDLKPSFEWIKVELDVVGGIVAVISSFHTLSLKKRVNLLLFSNGIGYNGKCHKNVDEDVPQRLIWTRNCIKCVPFQELRRLVDGNVFVCANGRVFPLAFISILGIITIWPGEFLWFTRTTWVTWAGIFIYICAAEREMERDISNIQP